MRRFDDTERKILEKLVKSGGGPFSIIELVQSNWDKGYFEVSGYQQRVAVHLSAHEELETAMQKLVVVRDLIKYLEMSGLVSFWDTIPVKDNTLSCGNKSRELDPYFLTDIGIATDLLARANRRFLITEELRLHVLKGFRTRNEIRLDRNFTIFGVGFVILILLGLANIFANYQMLENGVSVRIEKLSRTSDNVLESQKLNQAILDSLQNQSKQLMILTEKISDNTDNMSTISDRLETHTKNVRYFLRVNRNRIDENRQVIDKTDSLLKSLVRGQ